MASSGVRNGVGPRMSAKPDRQGAGATPKTAAGKHRVSSAGGAGAYRRTSSGPLPAAAGGRAASDGVSSRVRVAVRLRPRNAEELAADADFGDCVELQPELKRLRLRKNNWESETYEFDEVLTDFSSQKRVYEVVAKPVVESVMEGYNGTVMAYGQTGTGKTFTLGRLGEEDTAARGIMVRAMEDILADITPGTDSVSVSYLQLYMEMIQDLLDPVNDNIAIVEDPRTGDVSLPGATVVEVRDQKSFVDLLRVGEAHRVAANTKLNTESSRSHAILMVNVRRSVKGRTEMDVSISGENGLSSSLVGSLRPPIVRKSKLVVVDLAGSERIDKSGSEGHTLEEAKSINLSLSALGKCINALAESSPHVPVRDSKLTRLLKDSFGGTARTSLVVTIGPSPRHRGETTSTIMFGQRAMKVENMVKLKEEFDYKSLCRKLDIELDKLIAENERQRKHFDDEVERIRAEAQCRIAEAERECKITLENKEAESTSNDTGEVHNLLQNEKMLRQSAEDEASDLKNQISHWKKLEATATAEIIKLQKMLDAEASQKEKLEEEIGVLRSQLLQMSMEADETRSLDKGDGPGKIFPGLDSLVSQTRGSQPREQDNGQKQPIAKLFEQVGLQKILSLLESEEPDVRVHAVKVVANLAAEEANQEKIVEAGGLTSLLMLLRSSEDETIRRVAAGAIANLAMNETNQDLIMAQGGVTLLSMTASDAEDPQTLRMVAGAIANLCGNDKLQTRLRVEGGIKALLGMVRCGHPDVLAQVARGIANFAKCESRAATQGNKMGKSLLIDDGALPWIVKNANNEAAPIRRHIELALCHLAQHEVNSKDIINEGALWELVRISRDCSREDIRNLAYRTLTSSPTLEAEMRRLGIKM
ncbi:kinesin-like protein KIN-UB isoform X2 [Zea mays]|uniref:kinesin-like protein KIN-UB isoform X2 n=2 Tax=Zea mays TaxID=4577 RepID=UPI0009AAC1A7|nr:kinesin-like protein KIN-UB isoform X2 [Zea mays]|eukprot:XP_020394852.1 kinesin-like protein KIN-UB isoform X2 [Zea mays]